MPGRIGRIRVEGVWKRFRRGQLHDSLRDLLPALSRRLVRSQSSEELRANEFWALRDLSFTVEPGQAIGIIGANGAGKSTALKIMTRILRPTFGMVEVVGRIGALIEVSAGFHGDLTGRENIFLQGSIMGMPQELIKRKFDEIVEFSGIGDFLDTPVKRYSSGMHARLGFSIAVHLDPEVLIVDEVLAVGDYRFQDRAFGRIRELVTSGIPVVMVSHQLDRIASLCTHAMVLERGTVAFRGSPGDAIGHYLSGTRVGVTDGDMASAVRLHSLVMGPNGAVNSGGAVELLLNGAVEDAELMKRETIVLRVRSAATGQVVFATSIDRCGVSELPPGNFRLRIGLEMNVRPGMYAFEPYVVTRGTGKEIGAGPIAHVQVKEDPGFFGTVQLKPRMSIEPSA
jgi:ABC-type polysaccharide/polyol phosphate transport system ATPase subunit